ncbi:DUF503 domain-containing protein [Hydrogenivirga sp. 128-5-R1-1]|uniref:DUF503 domain-containing protein n=1 Tax=Hydrogenivirga sp. 128-5-R1-1 TaxID=392423 RepID=UPI00015F0DB8|nr:DUF503 domain-containing protein [Hydrogenivirga sp. 128-5-R1-1]EDP74302.1 hypothetical protein HG1285_05415 [Hydrogenivirga sp. 128-5-R1-1]
MVIGSIVLDLYIPHATSLKEKRMIVRSLKEKLKSKFNVSVSEVGNQDLWQSANIAVVFVSPEKRQTEKIMQSIINFVETNFPDIYINIYKELI